MVKKYKTCPNNLSSSLLNTIKSPIPGAKVTTPGIPYDESIVQRISPVYKGSRELRYKLRSWVNPEDSCCPEDMDRGLTKASDGSWVQDNAEMIKHEEGLAEKLQAEVEYSRLNAEQYHLLTQDVDGLANDLEKYLFENHHHKKERIKTMSKIMAQDAITPLEDAEIRRRFCKSGRSIHFRTLAKEEVLAYRLVFVNKRLD